MPASKQFVYISNVAKACTIYSELAVYMCFVFDMYSCFLFVTMIQIPTILMYNKTLRI
jgi:hypothetical protein